MNKTSYLFATLALVLHTWVHSPIALAEDRRKLAVGAVLILTGDFAMQTNAFREGIELAFSDHNSSSSAPNVRLVLEDVKDARTSVSAVKKILNVDKVVAGIVTGYPDVMANAATIETAKVPFMTLWDASPEIDDAGQYIFSIGAWTPSSGEASAQFAVDALKSTSAAVITQNENWSESVGKSFIKKFQSLGGSVVFHVNLDPATTDYRTVLARLKAQKVDVIYAPLYGNVESFYRQIRELQVNLPVISSDVISPELVAQNPGLFEGIYQSSIADPDSDAFRVMESKYFNKFQKKLTLPWFVSSGYDAAWLLLHAVDKSGAPENISRYLYGVRDYEGATGRISISPQGSSPQLAQLFQIKEGKFEKVKAVNVR